MSERLSLQNRPVMAASHGIGFGSNRGRAMGTLVVSVAHLRAAMHHTNLFTFGNVNPIDFAGHGVEALCEHAV